MTDRVELPWEKTQRMIELVRIPERAFNLLAPLSARAGIVIDELDAMRKEYEERVAAKMREAEVIRQKAHKIVESLSEEAGNLVVRDDKTGDAEPDSEHMEEYCFALLTDDDLGRPLNMKADDEEDGWMMQWMRHMLDDGPNLFIPYDQYWNRINSTDRKAVIEESIVEIPEGASFSGGRP